MNQQQKRKLSWAFLATPLFYLLAHGYRFFHNMFSGDSLIAVYQDDYAWQIALGRCFNPVWMFLRGTLTSPWLLSVLGIVWMSLAVFCTADFLNIENQTAVILLAAVMTVNPVITCLNATFLPWTDLQIFALFLNAAGVWLLKEKKTGSLLAGILFLALGLGTYQAYLTFAVSLVMIFLLDKLAEKKKNSQENKLSLERKLVLRYGISFLLAGLVYFICWKLEQKLFGIWTADSYNGLSALGDYGGISVWSLVSEAYKKVFLFFWDPEVFVSLYFRGRSMGIIWIWLLRLVNIAVVLMTVIMLLNRNQKGKTSVINRVLQGLLLLLFPLGMNFVYILSKGMEHTLMIFSFQAVYILAICLLFKPAVKKSRVVAMRFVCLAGVLSVCWVNLVFSNQVYLKKKMQEEAALSLMTRITNDVENYDGYLPGKTQVAFSGSLTACASLADPDGFADLMPYGMSTTPLFYAGTEEAFLKYYLNSAMILTAVDPNLEEVKKMPSYPMEGSIGYVGDVLVVKISDSGRTKIEGE